MNLINKQPPSLPIPNYNGVAQTGVLYTIDDAVDKIGYGTFQRRLVFMSGLAWTADACEIIILSIIGQILTCDWEIYRWQIALLTTSVFVGMMLGSPIFGTLADRFGRRKSVSASLILLFTFGSLSAASPSYYWILVLRACTGFALGGVPQLMTLTCEYCPVNMRGIAGFYLCYFWGIGTMGLVLLAWVVMVNTGNWRLLLAVTALPTLLVLFMIKFLPESVRYYLASNQTDNALKLLKNVAKVNKKELPVGTLAPFSSKSENRGRMCDLLSREYRRSTLIFWYIWLATAFCYYSVALISPLIIQQGSLVKETSGNSTWESFIKDFSGVEKCSPLTSRDYIDLLWTSAAELPALLIFTLLIERLDRRKLMCGACIASAILVLLLVVNTKRYLTLIFLFGARGIILSAFQLTLLMTSEAFPTSLRAIAMGSGSGWCRIGGLICPYVSQVLVVSSPIATVCILSVITLLAGVAALCLPFETRGMALFEGPIKTKRNCETLDMTILSR